jgi:hypothetical protein
VKLVPNADLMRRVTVNAAQIKAKVDADLKAGELQWFNRAYREYRARHPKAMLYNAAKNKLYRALTRRLMFAGRLDLDANILGEVFGSAEA